MDSCGFFLFPLLPPATERVVSLGFIALQEDSEYVGFVAFPLLWSRPGTYLEKLDEILNNYSFTSWKGNNSKG